MERFDLIVRGGMVVRTGAGGPAPQLGDIAVRDGEIAAVEPRIEAGAEVEVDASGLVILPGAIDAHVHCNEPGRTDWEGFATASRALAAGGATAFFDMPLNSSPVTIDGEAFDRKRRAAESCALVDFGLWGGLVPGSVAHLEELAQRGAVGIKAFMSSSGLDEFPTADDTTLLEGMARCAELGLMVGVHAENRTLTDALAVRAVAAGQTSARDYLASRPIVAELEAISRAILFAEDTGCALHVVHVSTGRGIALVAEARLRGVDVTCETCPHYLLLSEADLERIGPLAKCAPPLRPPAESEALWERLAGGEVDMVVSDHSPCPPRLKETANMFAAWGGISGAQTTLPLLITDGHVQRELALGAIARLAATAAADRFRLPAKGRIEPGADADLALVDIGARGTVDAEELAYRHRVSAWVGRPVAARVRRTILRGRTVYENGRWVGETGGRLLTPERRPKRA